VHYTSAELKPRRRTIGFVIVGVILSIAAVSSVFRLPTKPDVRVEFLGFTNSSSQTAARFELSNNDSHALGFCIGTIERGAIDWQTNSNHLIRIVTAMGAARKVAPGGRYEFIQTLTNIAPTDTWCIPIEYSRLPTRFDSIIGEIREKVGQSHVIMAWLTNTPEMTGTNGTHRNFSSFAGQR
jgi:hypothetical protein